MVESSKWWVLGVVAACVLPAAASAQVYVQGGGHVQVQGQVQVQGGYAPAQPQPAPVAGTTAGTVQGRGGFVGGELLIHGWTGNGAGVYGASLPIRWGWELSSGLMPYLEAAYHVSGRDGRSLGWYHFAGGARWTFYNSSALAPFLGALLGVAGVDNWYGETVAASFILGLEGGLLVELSKFFAITGAARYQHFLDGSGVGYFGLGGGLVVFY